MREALRESEDRLLDESQAMLQLLYHRIFIVFVGVMVAHRQIDATDTDAAKFEGQDVGGLAFGERVAIGLQLQRFDKILAGA